MPIVRQRKGEYLDRIDDARARGFTRMRIDGRVIAISSENRAKAR